MQFYANMTKKQKKAVRIAVAVFVVICLLVELISYIPGISFNGWQDIGAALGIVPAYVTAEGEMEVHFLDVGNADCIFVRQKDKTLLIDAGERKNAEDVITYLHGHGVKRLDLVIATHPHSDHIGAMSEVIDEFPISTFIMSFMPDSATPTTGVYLSMLESLDQHGVTVEEAEPGRVYELGSARLQILAPLFETEDINDISVVSRLTFGKRAFLFTGDAGKEVEAEILSRGYTVSADVLKLSHHGSNTGNCSSFLQRVKPRYGMITCGWGNRYGHPHKEPLQRLDKLGVTYYRSDENGRVVFTTDGDTISIDCEVEN